MQSWQLGGVQTHLALDVRGVQLSVVVLGDDLHYILLLKSIFIHPLHGAHTLNRNWRAHLQTTAPIRTGMHMMAMMYHALPQAYYTKDSVK